MMDLIDKIFWTSTIPLQIWATHLLFISFLKNSSFKFFKVISYTAYAILHTLPMFVDMNFDTYINCIAFAIVFLQIGYKGNLIARIKSSVICMVLYWGSFLVVDYLTMYVLNFGSYGDLVALAMFRVSFFLGAYLIFKYSKSRQDLEVITLRDNAYKNQENIMEQSFLENKELSHDMKNHIMALRAMYENENSEKANIYSENLLSKIEKGENYSTSGNFLVDSLVNFKLNQITDVDVIKKIKINIPLTINIAPDDFTVILGNLLDNAITAVKLCEYKKFISFNMSYSKGNLIILTQNSYDGNIITENGQIKTSKKIKGNHGLGLTNIKSVVKKLNGEIDIDYDNNVFSVSIIIPIEN